MSYIRSRRSGLGQFATGSSVPVFNTSQPAASFAPITTPPTAPIALQMERMLPYNPTGPIDPGSEDFSTPISHRAPAASSVIVDAFVRLASDPSAAEKFKLSQVTTVAAEQAKCSSAGGVYTPGGSECDVDVQGNLYNCKPATASTLKKYYCIPSAAAGGSVAIAGAGAQKSAAGTTVNAFSSGSGGSGGSDSGSKTIVDTNNAPIGITQSQLSAACAQVKGKMGSGCCLMPNGVAVGITNGQLAQISSCKSGMGAVPLIAGAAIAAVLLMRFM